MQKSLKKNCNWPLTLFILHISINSVIFLLLWVRFSCILWIDLTIDGSLENAKIWLSKPIFNVNNHGLRTPSEEICFTAQPKINSHLQIFRYGQSIFCLPNWPKSSDFFDLCLHWVSVVRVNNHLNLYVRILIFDNFNLWSTISQTMPNCSKRNFELEIRSFVPRKILEIFSCFIKVKEFSVGHPSSGGMHVEIFDIGRRLRLDWFSPGYIGSLFSLWNAGGQSWPLLLLTKNL